MSRYPFRLSKPVQLSLLVLTAYLAAGKADASAAQKWIDAFARSDIDLMQSDSNTPGLNMAFIDVTEYSVIQEFRLGLGAHGRRICPLHTK